MNIEVVLVDDHTIVRQGLRAALDQEPDIKIVAEAADGRTAADTVLEHRPDVVVMDVNMPGLNGIDATRMIKESLPRTRVLGLSVFAHQRYVMDLLKAGASGYMLKTAPMEELVLAIRTLAQGRTYLSAEISDIVVDAAQYDEADSKDGRLRARLTPREREVVQLVAEGHTNRSVAEILFVSEKTVEAHRRKIMRKLNLNNSAELVKYAIREGLTDVD